MHTFNDIANRTWSMAVNVNSIKRVRAMTGIDLLSAVDGTLFKQLAADPILLCDVVYALVKPEADQRQISDEQFGQAMAGIAIEQASRALMEELADFFPEEKRKLLHKLITKMDKLETIALAAVDQRLESDHAEQVLAAELAKLGDWSGAAPESAASIPAP